jgi:hypothetical protein
MSLRNTYKTDNAKEVEGVWITVDADENGKETRIHVSRMSKSNKIYAKAAETKFAPHTAAIQNETIPEALAARLIREIFAEVILHNWEGVSKFDLTGDEADKDTPLEFSKENALALFAELPDLFDAWEAQAKKAGNFREAEKKVSAKN